jgi:hypothetical protein
MSTLRLGARAQQERLLTQRHEKRRRDWHRRGCWFRAGCVVHHARRAGCGVGSGVSRVRCGGTPSPAEPLHPGAYARDVVQSYPVAGEAAKADPTEVDPTEVQGAAKNTPGGPEVCVWGGGVPPIGFPRAKGSEGCATRARMPLVLHDAGNPTLGGPVGGCVLCSGGGGQRHASRTKPSWSCSWGQTGTSLSTRAPDSRGPCYLPNPSV